MTDKIINDIFQFIEKYFLLFSLGILLVASYNYLYHLDAEKVWDWDEARAGVTAYEMLQNHNFVDSTYVHKTELWNLKPPLGLWFIALDYKLFGFNVFALRFYSGFCCLLSVLIVLWFMAKNAGKSIAVISGYILASTGPMIFIHGARSGDYSPLFTFLVLLFIVFLYMSENNTIYLYAAGFIFSLSFLVYSFAAFQLLVLAGVYLFVTGLYKKINFKSGVGFVLFSFAPIGGWIVWRLNNVDGLLFLKGMVSYDLFKRATQSLEGHGGNTDYYLTSLVQSDPYWFTFLAIVLLLFLGVSGFKLILNNRLLIISSLGVIVPLVLFSLAQTKLGWYLIPSYPPLAIVIACLFLILIKEQKFQSGGKVVLLILFLIAGIRAEREIYKSIKQPKMASDQVLLNEFKNSSPNPNSDFYNLGWTQADVFIVEVILKMNPKWIGTLDECLNRSGYLFLEKKSLKNNSFVKDHHLSIVQENGDWMIVKL